MSRQMTSAVETLVATAGTGAVLYFCFTRAGQGQLRQFERWLEAGSAETSRMVSTLERVAMIVAAVGGVVGLVNQSGHASRPSEGRSAAIENLLSLPSALRASPHSATVR